VPVKDGGTTNDTVFATVLIEIGSFLFLAIFSLSLFTFSDYTRKCF
jgi:hypothetical protein